MKGATPKVIHCNESVAIKACFYQERIGTEEIERGCGDEDHFNRFLEANAAPNNTNINVSSEMDKCMQNPVMRTCLCSQPECNGNCESENCKMVTSDEEENEVCDPKCTKMTNSNSYLNFVNVRIQISHPISCYSMARLFSLIYKVDLFFYLHFWYHELFYVHSNQYLQKNKRNSGEPQVRR